MNKNGNFDVSRDSPIVIEQEIQYLHIAHNTHCLPPKILHKNYFWFLMGIAVLPRESEKNNAYALFWEVNIRKHFQMTTAAILVFQTNPMGVEKLNSFFM